MGTPTSTKMKAALIFLSIFVIAVSAQGGPPTATRRHHEMPNALRVLSQLPKLLKKPVKGDPINDCMTCYNDVQSAIDHCGNVSDDVNEILACVESVLATSADCIVCICDIIAILGGADSSACDPAKIVQLR